MITTVRPGRVSGRSLVATVLALALLAGAAPTRTAEAAGPLTRIASLPLGVKAHSIVVVGNLAYIGTATGLTIVNVATPSSPIVLGTVTTSRKTLGLAVRGSYAFLAGYTGDLEVINVSNPSVPALIKTFALPSYAWDIAMKDNIAYIATFAGEIFGVDVTNPAAPKQIKIIGVPAWTTGNNAANLAKLNSGSTSGNAKVTGVAVAGDRLFAVDWNYGRLYMWDITTATAPVFAGTQYIPFTFRVIADPANDTVYSFAAFGNSSGVYSTPISFLDPSVAQTLATCGTDCDYFKSVATDYAGMALSATGHYLAYVGGKVGELRVLDVSDPTNMISAGVFPLGSLSTKTGESLGVAIVGETIFAAAGGLGLQVFTFPGLAN